MNFLREIDLIIISFDVIYKLTVILVKNNVPNVELRFQDCYPQSLRKIWLVFPHDIDVEQPAGTFGPFIGRPFACMSPFMALNAKITKDATDD